MCGIQQAEQVSITKQTVWRLHLLVGREEDIFPTTITTGVRELQRRLGDGLHHWRDVCRRRVEWG